MWVVVEEEEGRRGFCRVGTGSRRVTGRKRWETGRSCMACCSSWKRRVSWRFRRMVK